MEEMQQIAANGEENFEESADLGNGDQQGMEEQNEIPQEQHGETKAAEDEERCVFSKWRPSLVVPCRSLASIWYMFSET